MKIGLNFYANVATIEEAQELAKLVGCPKSGVDIGPNGKKPADYVYFGIQQMMAKDHLSLIFDEDPDLYISELSKLKKKLLSEISEILDSVIADNEKRFIE